MKAISRSELQDILHEPDGAVVINVLDRSQYQEHHIPGSINIPVSKDDFVERVETTVGDKSSRVVVYCASSSCDASEKAAKKLDTAGFQHVLDYEEGMKGWENADLPVATGVAAT